MSFEMLPEKSIAEFIKAQQQEEYPPYPEQLAAIREALEHHERPIAPLAEKIARRILEAIEKRKNDPTADPYSYSLLWRTITAAVKELSSQIGRVVDLVVALSEVDDPSGYMAQMQDMNMHWNEFAMGFTEPDLDDPNKQEDRQAWININTFNAKISTCGIKSLDNRLRSAHVFRIALEETPWEVSHWPDIEEYIEDDPDDPESLQYRDRMLERRSIRRLNYWAPAAATWIVNDGNGIYNMTGPMIGDNYSNYEPTNWKGAKGFSKERFQYWRERFEWVAQVTALDHDTRKRAAEAAELMKQIQGAQVE